MRNLYRGKRVDDDEWVEGYLLQSNLIVPAGQIFDFCKYNDRNIITSDSHFVFYEVIPETVGQHTGLIDKNGVKIFERDFLNGFHYPFLRDNSHNYFAEVVWFDDCPAFGLYTHKYPSSTIMGICEGNCELMEEFDSSQWEVVGNRYDNLELLEVK